MPVVVALLLILAVHAGTNLAAWSRVGLLADDRFAVGMPIWFDLQHTPWAERLHSVFFPAVQADAAAALYRPLVALLFLIEYPLFGVEACYYHAVNSVFHCTTALVWFVLVRRWTSSPAAGLAVALTFVGWVGHSEATHWVSARVNLQAMCFLSLSLLVWDNAERAGSGPGRSRWNWARQGASLGLGLLALGAKESAILILPMAFLVSWLRAEEVGGVLARLRRSVFRVVPVLLLVLAFAVLRRGVLHTWGAGARSAWHLDVASPAAWATALWDWLVLLMAPVHSMDASAWWRPVLWATHLSLLALSLLALRQKELRKALGFAAVLLVIVMVAVAGLHVDAETLENMRYSYEPALALCLLFGLGIAGLPRRARLPVLACVVLIHAIVLDQNRECWLRAGDVQKRMVPEIQAAAQKGPVRVLDAPGQYDGAFLYLIENSMQILWWPPMQPGVLQGRISSSDEWPAVLSELAGHAAARRPLTNAYTVAWADGSLVPLALDATWPQTPWQGTTIEYARIGRQRPFLGSDLPVQCLLRSPAGVSVFARGRVGDRVWAGPILQREAPAAPAALQVFLPLGSELPADVPVEVELVIRGPSGEQAWPLGAVVPAVRRQR